MYNVFYSTVSEQHCEVAKTLYLGKNEAVVRALASHPALRAQGLDGSLYTP